MKQIVIMFASALRYTRGLAQTHLTLFTEEVPKVIQAVKTARAEIITAAKELKIPEIGHSIGATMDSIGKAHERAGAEFECAFNGSEFDVATYERKSALRAARERKMEREWAESVGDTEEKKAKEAAEEAAKEEKELAELLEEEKVVSIH